MTTDHRHDIHRYLELLAAEAERARHVWDKFPRTYEDQLEELRKAQEPASRSAAEVLKPSGPDGD